jgi:hypothetical protein
MQFGSSMPGSPPGRCLASVELRNLLPDPFLSLSSANPVHHPSSVHSDDGCPALLSSALTLDLIGIVGLMRRF